MERENRLAKMLITPAALKAALLLPDWCEILDTYPEGEQVCIKLLLKNVSLISTEKVPLVKPMYQEVEGKHSFSHWEESV